jgi:hypothetical protein
VGYTHASPTLLSVRGSDWAGNYHQIFVSGGNIGHATPNPYPFIVNAYRPLWWVSEHTPLRQPMRAYGDWWVNEGMTCFPMD